MDISMLMSHRLPVGDEDFHPIPLEESTTKHDGLKEAVFALDVAFVRA